MVEVILMFFKKEFEFFFFFFWSWGREAKFLFRKRVKIFGYSFRNINKHLIKVEFQDGVWKKVETILGI